MKDQHFTAKDVAREFQVHERTARMWFTYFENAGFPFTTSGHTRALHVKDLIVVREFRALQASGLKIEEAAEFAVAYWRNHQSHRGHHSAPTCEDRSVHILLEMTSPANLKHVLLELSQNRNAVLDEVQLKNALIDLLSDQEVRRVCKRLA